MKNTVILTMILTIFISSTLAEATTINPDEFTSYHSSALNLTVIVDQKYVSTIGLKPSTKYSTGINIINQLSYNDTTPFRLLNTDELLYFYSHDIFQNMTFNSKFAKFLWTYEIAAPAPEGYAELIKAISALSGKTTALWADRGGSWIIGAEGQIFDNSIALHNDVITTPTPEPATIALLGVGLISMAATLRKKRQ